MKRFLVLMTALTALATSPAFAQSDGAPGGMPGTDPSMGDMRSRTPRAPKPPKPVLREDFDKQVRAQFQLADVNSNGAVTLQEVNDAITIKRDAIIQSHFELVDSNRDKTISHDEFFTWQRRMSDTALTDQQSVVAKDKLQPPKAARDRDDMASVVLRRLIEPITAMTIANADTNHDGGLSLAESLAYQQQAFETADADHDGALSMDETRPLLKIGSKIKAQDEGAMPLPPPDGPPRQ